VKAWRESGLLYPSIVTGIIRTIKHDMIARKFGALPAPELHAVQDKLRDILGCDLAPRSREEAGSSRRCSSLHPGSPVSSRQLHRKGLRVLRGGHRPSLQF
jgi:hypothetical protein